MTPWANGAKGGHHTHTHPQLSVLFLDLRSSCLLCYFSTISIYAKFNRSICLNQLNICMSAIVHMRDSSFFQQQDNVWIIWLWWAQCPAVPSASSLLLMRRATVCRVNRPVNLRANYSLTPPGHRVTHQPKLLQSSKVHQGDCSSFNVKVKILVEKKKVWFVKKNWLPQAD